MHVSHKSNGCANSVKINIIPWIYNQAVNNFWLSVTTFGCPYYNGELWLQMYDCMSTEQLHHYFWLSSFFHCGVNDQLLFQMLKQCLLAVLVFQVFFCTALVHMDTHSCDQPNAKDAGMKKVLLSRVWSWKLNKAGEVLRFGLDRGVLPQPRNRTHTHFFLRVIFAKKKGTVTYF